MISVAGSQQSVPSSRIGAVGCSIVVWLSSSKETSDVVEILEESGIRAMEAASQEEVVGLLVDNPEARCLFSGYLRELISLEDSLRTLGISAPIIILSEASSHLRSRDHDYLVLSKPFSVNNLIEGDAEQRLVRSRPQFMRRLGHLTLYENRVDSSFAAEGCSAKDLLNVFQDSLDFQLENLYYGLQTENWNQILVSARALAGNSETAGAISFFELSRSLEAAARSQSFMSARLLVSDLTAEANRLRTRLEAPLALAA